MSDTKAATPRLEMISFEQYSQFAIHSRLEIANLLRSVSRKKRWLTLYADKGHYFLLSMLLFVDARNNELILDCATDPELNRQLLAAEQLVVVTEMDGVHLQFAVPRAQIVRYQGVSAFKMPLPDSMIKLQRREYYRALAPADSRPNGTLPLPNNQLIHFEVIDISGGGANIIFYTDGIKEMHTYPGCRINLPGIGSVEAELQVRHINQVLLANGAIAIRAGCQFIGLAIDQQTIVQRYILELERARRAQAWD